MANILPDLIKKLGTYFLLLWCVSAYAQELPTNDHVKIPQLKTDTDSTFVEGKIAMPDSVAVPDSTNKAVLEAPITYNASDSIVVSLDGQKVYLYNNAVVDYQTIELKANYIELNLNTKEVYAEGVPDSSGVAQGTPVFKDGDEEFECKTLRYRFDTQKGIITDVKTEEGDGYLQSDRTKKISANAFILKRGKYTTCDAEHPHFYLRMTKAKVISNKKIITGPAYLVLEDFPIYVAMIPFGFFPNSPTYSSGIIIPTYGEEQNRGFYLREGGYYWAASPYFDLTLKGDIYSKGSWGTNISTHYKKRYKYSGSLMFKYNVNKYGDPGLPDYKRSPGFSLNWSHSQDSKANPYQSFSASVQMSSSSYDKQNSYDVQSYLTTNKSSSISYSKKWENSPFNMSVSFRQSQNSRDTTLSISFPELTFSMAKIYPFKRKVRVGPKKWYEKIGVSYTGNIRNSISNVKEYDLFHKSIIKDWSNGWKHTIPISLPNFNILKYINISPSISYSERWYTNYLDKKYAYDHVTGDEVIFIDTIYHFRRNYNYSFSLSSQTNIYGMYTFNNPHSRIKAIRHKMSPSVSFSYNPDFSDPKYGFWDSYLDKDGNTVYYNRFQGAIFGSAGQGRSGAISFSLMNDFEAKLAAKNDTSSANSGDNKKKFEKIKLLNLGFSGSYNLIADSLNLSNIRISGRTTVKGVNLNFGATLDPYATNEKGTRINRFMWNEASGLAKLGRITNANMSFGMSFKSKTGKKEGESQADEAPMPLGVGYPQYAEFNIPWDFRFNYSFNYSKRSLYDKSTISQTLNFSGRLSLTDKWKMSMTTNFDIQAGKFSFTTFNVNRSLHCWNMSFNFVPFGQRKSYGFTLNASSSILKDLKVDKRRSWFDNNN